jgi:hypothetical protein
MRLHPRVAGGRATFSGPFNVRSAGLPLSPDVCWWQPPLLNFIRCTLVAVNFLTMLQTSSNESQAVLGRLFFSPSAATLCRGTPDPTLTRLSGSARRPALTPAGPGTGPPAGPDSSRARYRARSCWGTCRASSDPSALGGAGRIGPGPGSGRAGGPEPASTSGVSTTGRGGGCGASRVRDAGLRPHCSHPLWSLCCRVCLVLVCLLP